MPDTTRVDPQTGPFMRVSTNYDTTNKTYYLYNKLEVTIGYADDNDIVLKLGFVSGHHLKIIHQGSSFHLIHAAQGQNPTTNGLIYKGRHIKGFDELNVPMQHGDTFRIGDEQGQWVSLAFFEYDDQPDRLAHQTTIESIELHKQTITIGRSNTNDVVLPHPQISGQHAHLEKEQYTYRIIDLNSTNHVYVNGQQISAHLLRQDDHIRIGPFKFIYTGTHLRQYDESHSIGIQAGPLIKYGKGHAVLLYNIWLTIPPRSFVAILGGSGAGKSTLLNALSGFAPAEEGRVFFNGQDYYASMAAFRSQIGYVPQDDIVHRELTVESALYFGALLRLPTDYTKDQIEKRITEVLEDVHLTNRRRQIINKLSGGERKRVSIALELLAAPSIFFFDEPTSGLDVGLDFTIMRILRNLADRGRTVVLVTHTINHVDMCDSICFLARGGHMAYFGPPQARQNRFGTESFATIYNLLEPTEQNKDIPAKAAEEFNKIRRDKPPTSILPQNIPARFKRPIRNKPFRQFRLLSQRYVELLKNDWINLSILLLQAPIIGLLLMCLILAIGTNGFDANNVVQCPTTQAILTSSGQPDLPTAYNPVYSRQCSRLQLFLTHNPQGIHYAATQGGTIAAIQPFIQPGKGYAPTILFIMAFSAIMFGCINAAREIVKETPIYRRERAANLGILPYLFSKIAVLSLLCLLQSLILVTCVNVFDPFHQGIFLPPFLEIYITISLTSLVGLMMGLAVSAFVPNSDRAMSLVPLLLLPQVIFSGTIFPLNNRSMQIPAMLFAVRWAMAALGSSMGLHSDKINGDTLFNTDQTFHGLLYSTYSKANAVNHLLLIWGALLTLFIFLIIITALLLKRKDIRAASKKA